MIRVMRQSINVNLSKTTVMYKIGPRKTMSVNTSQKGRFKFLHTVNSGSCEWDIDIQSTIPHKNPSTNVHCIHIIH